MTPALACSGLDAGYHGRALVRGVDLEVDSGDILAVLGPNGAGKTTLLNALTGFAQRLSGSISVHGKDVSHAGTRRLARSGVVLVPDDRSLFASLSVREHISLAARGRIDRVNGVLDRVPGLRPLLEVKAGLLSGGEQQQLAIARALAQRPRVLLIDEMSIGLAPSVVRDLLEVLSAVARVDRTAVVLVEQHVSAALEIASRVLLLQHGRKVFEISADDVRADRSRFDAAFLGGRHAGRER